MKFSFHAGVNFALSLGLSLIVLSITASYITIDALIDDTQDERKSQEVALFLEKVGLQFKNSESLQRRYLLTGADRDLQAYEEAKAEIRRIWPSLLRLDAGIDAKTRLQPLEGLIQRRVDLMDQTVKVRQEAGIEAATAIVSSRLNRQLHDDIETLAAQIAREGSQALERSRQDTLDSARAIKLLILLGGVLSLSVLGWASLMMGRARVRRRRVEAQLKDSEAMSRAVTESMAEGLVTVTADGRIVHANSAIRHMFGYRLEDLVDQEVTLLLPQRYRSGFRLFFADLDRRQRGFREWDVKVLGLKHDGSEFPVNVSFGDVTAGGERLFTAIIHDITESNRIAEALRDSEAQLRQLTDTVPALIAYVDSDERFQFHNKAYEEAFGLSREQIQHKTMLEVMGAELYGQVQKHVQEVLLGYSVRYEREQTLPGGERREYTMNYFPRYGEGEDEEKVVGFFSLGTDISELKRIDRMKSEFVSTVSHELRTPLTSIRGSLGLVWGGVAGELPEKAKGLIGIARSNCERLIRLINDILDSEKIESGKMHFEMEKVDLDDLLEQAIAANEGMAAQTGVKLELRSTRRPVRVHVDVDRLIQVMTNLLSNAIKYSPGGGTVDVAVRTGGGRVRVEVTDNGSGIPPEFSDRIFRKFSQADSSDTRQKGGTGLGLNISRTIIERMEGTMGFASEPNVKTTFYFELPEWREAPPVTAPMSLFDVMRPRVLVCEDDPDVAKLIGLMLDNGGYDADIAHTPGQARDYLRMNSYAAMTADIKLPYENGIDLIKSLRRDPRTANLPILVLSASAGEARLQVDAHSLAVSAWLDKPLDEQLLLRSLRKVAKSGSMPAAAR